MIALKFITMRAFVFSLDAFVAFMLSLVAIYSLIFFSSVPSAYYYLLTQGNYLVHDTLLSLSTTTCTSDYGVCVSDAPVIDNIVAQPNPNLRSNLIQQTVGRLIPNQFGYRLEVANLDSSGSIGSWSVLYDTADNSGDSHAKESKKLAVSSQMISVGYSGRLNKLSESPYTYITCGLNSRTDDSGDSSGSSDGGSDEGNSWGIITCGVLETYTGSESGAGSSSESGEGSEGSYVGNIHPSHVFGGDIVPSLDAKVIRLTVYI